MGNLGIQNFPITLPKNVTFTAGEGGGTQHWKNVTIKNVTFGWGGKRGRANVT